MPRRKKNKRTNGGDDVLYEILGLTGFLVGYLAIMLVFESTITSIKLFSIIMTLGGLETYFDTVIGSFILFFIFGLAIILAAND